MPLASLRGTVGISGLPLVSPRIWGCWPNRPVARCVETDEDR